MHIHRVTIPEGAADILHAALQMAYGGENSRRILIEYAQNGLDMIVNALKNYNNFKQSPVDYRAYYNCSFQVGSE
jgi:hypothetical protein